MTSERTWDWADWIARHSIACAARRVSGSLSERLEEEWLADLSTRRGPMLRLRFAAGCVWAANVIANERAEPTVYAFNSPVVHEHFIRFPKHDFPFVTSGAVAFVLIVSLFTTTFYGLALGLGLQ